MSHTRLLLTWTLVARLATLGLLLAAARLLPTFDASARLVDVHPWARPLLRWDAFHFLHIAQSGYTHENHWAFLPGLFLAIRFASRIFHSDLLLAVVPLVVACDATQTLYRLSLFHLGSRKLALLAALLSLLPSSPTTLHFAPYTEPFFTYLSYKGMLFCAQSKWLAAALVFALAGAFRSTGVPLAGYIIWGLVCQPLLDRKPIRPVYALTLTAIVAAPFAYHNYAAYRLFCAPSLPSLPSLALLPTIYPSPPALPPSHIPEWCHGTLPLVYTHAQGAYWNVGFFRYWTPAQLPNFLLAAPPLVLFYVFSSWHVGKRLRGLLANAKPADVDADPTNVNANTSPPVDPFLRPSITPHALHALFVATTLLVASHVQIVLRQAASTPIIYWAAAWALGAGTGAGTVTGGGAGAGGEEGDGKLSARRSRWGRWWVAWSVAWGGTSVVLWAAGLPPA